MAKNRLTMLHSTAPSDPHQPGVDQPYRVKVSLRFVILSLLSSILVAFAVGKTVRVLLIDAPALDAFLVHQRLLTVEAEQKQDRPGMKLPTPIMKEGKVIPRTAYTSKNFDTARSTSTNSRWLRPSDKQECVDSATQNETLLEEDEEEHAPAGQHLLIDIENVDGQFLDSEERLAAAMLDLVNECGLTLLSYHCHRLQPSGVTCVGVLLESHVSFHTWPERGVITLDLFTCGPNSLLPVVPTAEKLFGVPIVASNPGKTVEKPQMIWAHKFRGFRPDDDGDAAELSDMFDFPVGQRLDYKEEVGNLYVARLQPGGPTQNSQLVCSSNETILLYYFLSFSDCNRPNKVSARGYL